MNTFCYTLSIFYNKHEFPNLIKKAVLPFFAIMEEKKYLNNYLIYCGEQRGSHLKLRLECFEEHKNKSLEEASNYFRDYLSRNPSENTEIKLPIHDIFLPYPNNSIQFNTREVIRKIKANFNQELDACITGHLFKTSKFLINYSLKNDDYFYEDISYLRIHFHLIFIYTLELNAEEADKILDNILQKVLFLNYNGDLEIYKLLDNLYEENLDHLNEYYQEIAEIIFTETHQEEDLKRWTKICKEAGEQLKDIISSSQIDRTQISDIYSSILLEVDVLIRNEHDIFVFYCIKKSLKYVTAPKQ